jgi:hypothetical protein
MEHVLEPEHDRKRSYWLQHIEKWQRSGQRQRDYCRMNGIALATFGYWRRKLKKNDSARPRFYPLVVSSGTLDTRSSRHDKPGLRLMLEDGRFSIEIDDHFSPSLLQKLINTLEQL